MREIESSVEFDVKESSAREIQGGNGGFERISRGEVWAKGRWWAVLTSFRVTCLLNTSASLADRGTVRREAMASKQAKAEAPLPAFVVERMKLWDELKAEADSAAAGTSSPPAWCTFL